MDKLLGGCHPTCSHEAEEPSGTGLGDILVEKLCVLVFNRFR